MKSNPIVKLLTAAVLAAALLLPAVALAAPEADAGHCDPSGRCYSYVCTRSVKRVHYYGYTTRWQYEWVTSCHWQWLNFYAPTSQYSTNSGCVFSCRGFGGYSRWGTAY